MSLCSASMNVERVRIDSITPDPANVRIHDERNISAIKASLQRFGQQHPLIIDSHNVIRVGNGRYEAMRALGWEECDVVRTSLTGSEATAFAIADNRTAELATWDHDGLIEQLRQLQVDDRELVIAAGYDEAAFLAMATPASVPGLPDIGSAAMEPSETANPYTPKIEVPIYEPTGECPPVAELCDTTKTHELLAEIEQADLPDDVRTFLRHAADRHTVFHFANIAEFYAHASPEVQRLMERSALVIIDFDKALENGLVAITKYMGQLASIETSDAE